MKSESKFWDGLGRVIHGVMVIAHFFPDSTGIIHRNIFMFFIFANTCLGSSTIVWFISRTCLVHCEGDVH